MLSDHLSRLQLHKKNKQQSTQLGRVATEISLKRSKVKIIQQKRVTLESPGSNRVDKQLNMATFNSCLKVFLKDLLTPKLQSEDGEMIVLSRFLLLAITFSHLLEAESSLKFRLFSLTILI